MSTRITYSLSTGARGPQGDAGEGVPTGGTTGQVLTKTSGTDYDTEWATSAGGGAVTSVAGRTGAVTLSSADITDATSDAIANPEKLIKSDANASLTLASLSLGSDQEAGTISIYGTTYQTTLNASLLTADRNHYLPNASGTLALTGSAAGVPDALTNGTIAGTLNITAGTITVTNQSTFRDAIGLGTANSPTFAGGTMTNYTEAVVAIGNSSTAQTLSLTNGTVQTCTLTGNCTFTMPTATAGKSFVLYLKTGTGGFTGAFTGVKWSGGTTPTITATASRMDILTFVADGTNWYGQIAQNYTP